MIRSILVAVHRSPAVSPAMAQAARLARLARARIKALYVEDLGRFIYVPMLTWATAPLLGDQPIYATLEPRDLLAEQERQGEEGAQLRAAFKEICAKENLTGEFAVQQGSVEEVLLAGSRSVDLLVMGYRHGPFLTGALVERVLRRSVRPILVVWENARMEGPMLFAYDGSRAAQRSLAVGAALIGLSAWKSIHIVTAADDPDEAQTIQDEAMAFLEPYTSDLGGSHIVGDAAAAILTTAERIGAGLIVMGAFGDAPMTELLFGSTTSDVLAEAPCPVLLAS